MLLLSSQSLFFSHSGEEMQEEKGAKSEHPEVLAAGPVLPFLQNLSPQKRKKEKRRACWEDGAERR